VFSMVDPVTGAAIGGAANAVGNTVIEEMKTRIMSSGNRK